MVQLQENACFHHWQVDFHSIYHRGVSHGMEVIRRPVRGRRPLELGGSHAINVMYMHGNSLRVNATADMQPSADES